MFSAVGPTQDDLLHGRHQIPVTSSPAPAPAGGGRHAGPMPFGPEPLCSAPACLVASDAPMLGGCSSASFRAHPGNAGVSEPTAGGPMAPGWSLGEKGQPGHTHKGCPGRMEPQGPTAASPGAHPDAGLSSEEGPEASQGSRSCLVLGRQLRVSLEQVPPPAPRHKP